MFEDGFLPGSFLEVVPIDVGGLFGLWDGFGGGVQWTVEPCNVRVLEPGIEVIACGERAGR